jgi:hypothetical protein
MNSIEIQRAEIQKNGRSTQQAQYQSKQLTENQKRVLMGRTPSPNFLNRIAGLMNYNGVAKQKNTSTSTNLHKKSISIQGNNNGKRHQP